MRARIVNANSRYRAARTPPLPSPPPSLHPLSLPPQGNRIRGFVSLCPPIEHVRGAVTRSPCVSPTPFLRGSRIARIENAGDTPAGESSPAENPHPGREDAPRPTSSGQFEEYRVRRVRPQIDAVRMFRRGLREI